MIINSNRAVSNPHCDIKNTLYDSTGQNPSPDNPPSPASGPDPDSDQTSSAEKDTDQELGFGRGRVVFLLFGLQVDCWGCQER